MTTKEQSSISAQEVPKVKLALEEKYKAEPKKEIPTEAAQLPQPTGWRILVLPYQGTGKTKGGILLADETVEMHQVATVCGYVLRMGPDAYKDKDKFLEGPWCKEKDWVIFGRYAGSRLKIEGGEIRLLNDDEILAKISNPEDILHLY